jgi:hypothetical protein
LAKDLEGLESSDDKNPTTYTSPDGGCIELPSGATNIHTIEGKTTHLRGTNKDVNVVPGSLNGFTFNGKSYEAKWNTSTGQFGGYGSYDENGLPSLSYSNSTITETSFSIQKPQGAGHDFEAAGAAGLATSEVPQVGAAVGLTATVVTAGKVVLSAIVITAVAHNIDFTPPKSSVGGFALAPPFAIPLAYTTTDGITTTADQNGKITLFRGVSSEHAAFPMAVLGMAVPIGGDATPLQHNLGNTKSEYTSWTINPWVAYVFATGKYNTSGIILVKQFNISELTVSPDKFQQGEVLIKGTVTGAVPVPVPKPSDINP